MNIEAEYEDAIMALERCLRELLAKPDSTAARDRGQAAIKNFWFIRKQRKS
jgi:hypothetical protein